MLSDAHDLPDAPRGVIQFLFSLIQVMYLFFYVISLARLRWVEPVLSQAVQHPKWIFALLLVTALVGIPLRLYLLSAAIFGYRGLPVKFLRLFPFVIPLDELWALAPFLLVDEIGVGLALAATAALLYLPFSQRSLMLMGEINPSRPEIFERASDFEESGMHQFRSWRGCELLPARKTGGRYETDFELALRFCRGLSVPRSSGRRGHVPLQIE